MDSLKRWARRGILGISVALVVLVSLFGLNGLDRSWETPVLETLATTTPHETDELTVLALNLAKCGFHQGGYRFTEKATIEARLRRVVAMLKAQNADLVCLSEVVFECGPVNVDQAAFLAKEAGYGQFLRGDNKNFGLPFFRIRGGNALLSRRPLRTLGCIQLAGAKPFWSPTNNRRALFGEITLGGETLVVGSLRNDSFDMGNNGVQMDEIRTWLGSRDAILAGDFNADPTTRQMRALRESGRFVGTFEGPSTFPTESPKRTIDYVLAPSRWRLLESRVVDSGVSDHLAVVAKFAIR